MGMALTRMTGFSLAAFSLAGLLACTTDDNDPGVDADDSSSSSTSSGSDTTSGSGGTDSGSSSETNSTGSGGNTQAGSGVCAFPVVLDSSAAGIANFEDYDGAAELSSWSFPLGGNVAISVFAGPFGYGDEANGFPEAFEMVDGDGSTYALSISDTDSQEYGGGMGIWISECLDASAFSGMRFSVRGSAPTGDAKLSILMGDTTPDSEGETLGTCPGSAAEGTPPAELCASPTYTFPVTDEWTEIEIPWRSFEPGSAGGLPVPPDGSNIWQIQFDIGLEWLLDEDTQEYVAQPGAYELVIDDLTFY